MEDPNNSIKSINVDEEIKSSFLDYSMSVIISRALPDVRDGLKPSQRRILYAMHELSLYPPKKQMKCAKICGDTSGNYHPHGESVIYPTLVNMGQPWSIREPLIDPQGNFGSIEGDPPAAMRYTEARMTHLGGLLMEDMEKDTVDFVPNYDERLTEPTVFPAAFPNLLVNGGTGIAVGMATNMPPHNLGEVVDGICAQIDNPHISVTELMTHIKGPDFPTGCTIRGTAGIREYLETGHGSVRIRGHAEIFDTGTREQIIITAIPYGVNRRTLVERIAELVHEKILPEVTAVRDESDENSRVVIDLKRDARAQVVLNNIFKHTSLETSFSVHMLAIDNRRPRLLNLKDAISCYIEHRREVILRRTRYLLKKAEERAEKLEAFLGAIGHLDEFINIIRSSSSREQAFNRLKAYDFPITTAQGLGILIRSQASVVGDRYVFTDVQVNHILELRLYQLTGMEREKVKGEYDQVLAEIIDLMDILAREYRVLTIIKEELNVIKGKHAGPRLTQIEAAQGDMAIEDLIANESNIVTITHRGYIKRTLSTEYRTQARGGKGLKGMETRESTEGDEKDFVEHLFTASAHDYLLFFTNTGRVYVERVYVVPEMGRIGKGRSIKNMLNLRPEEKIAAVLRIECPEAGSDPWSDDHFVLFATKDGTVKKTALNAFRNIRKDGIIAINIEEGNDLIQVILTDGSKQICLVTHEGQCVKCEESQVRDMGRGATGVRGIRPDADDFVVSLTAVDLTAQLLVVSENGLGKRTPFDDYRLTSRGTKGVTTMNVTDKTGKVVAAMAVHDTDELMLMTSKGQSVRIRVADIRETGRNAQGVKLMDLGKGETVQDVARVIPDEDDASEETTESPEVSDESTDSTEA
ncbi:MAG: gyrase subunit [Verrucomicrobiota bacterium]